MRNQQFTLSDLPPRLLVEKPQLLPGMARNIHLPEVGQEVGHVFIFGILKPTDVRVQAPHENGVPLQEAVERLL